MICSEGYIMRKLISDRVKERLKTMNTQKAAKYFGCSDKTILKWKNTAIEISDSFYEKAMTLCYYHPISDVDAERMINELLLRLSKRNLLARVGYARIYQNAIHKHNGLIVNRWRYHKLLEVYKNVFKN